MSKYAYRITLPNEKRWMSKVLWQLLSFELIDKMKFLLDGIDRICVDIVGEILMVFLLWTFSRGFAKLR
jgi:hypothetical protein